MWPVAFQLNCWPEIRKTSWAVLTCPCLRQSSWRGIRWEFSGRILQLSRWASQERCLTTFFLRRPEMPHHAHLWRKMNEVLPGCAKFTAALHETASWPHAQKTQGIPLSSSFTFAGYPWLPNGYPSVIFSLLLQPSVFPSVARRPILIILLWCDVVSSWGLKTIIIITDLLGDPTV